MSEQDDMSAWGDALAEQAEAESGADDAAADWGDALSEQAEANKADLDDLSESMGASGGKNKVDLDVLLDVPVTLQLEIGRAKVSIRNLLSYTQGSVVEMIA
ncbi:hypothetical protein THIOSC13_870007 [uncultured Thiomicrorhabdus sp.]